MTVFKNDIIQQLIKQKDISFLMLALTMFLLPLSINLSSFTIILSLVFKIIQIVFLKQSVFKTSALKNSSIIGFVFFIYIIVCSIIQTDISYTFYAFEQSYQPWALLFLVPMLLRDKKTNTILFYSILLGVYTTLIYVFIVSLAKGNIFDQDAFLNIVDIHHTYLSMFLLFVVNYFLLKTVSNTDQLSIKSFLIYSLVITTCFFVIYILDSKVSIVIFIVLFIIHLFPQFSKKNAPRYFLIFLLVIAAFFAFNKKLKVSYLSALDFRSQIWEASIKVIDKHPFFGNLRAPEKELLNYEHYLSAKHYYLDRNLNSHNQYLSIFLKHGVFGIIILFWFAINMFKKTNPKTGKKTMREAIGFLTIIALIFYIENIMDRHHGIVFLTVFYNYYLVAIENEEN
uniref:O-antigen ligase family protein n=1 Tax=Gelidibacter sp. TaxID=2018083 RepID=UPI004049853A